MKRDYSEEKYLSIRKKGVHRLLHNLRVREAITAIPEGGKLILDLGASTCESTSLIRVARPQSLVVGLDRSLKQLQLGREGTSRLCADARQLPLPHESCCAIVMISTFKHVFYPEKLFNELKRVLSPEGTLVIIEPSWWVLKAAGRLGYFDLANIANLWKPQLYRERLNDGKFEVSRSGYFGSGLYQIVVAQPA